MNPQKNQGNVAPQLMQDLQTEVSAESAPLLRFILQNSSLIAGAGVIFLLLLGGTGIWRWYSDKKTDETQQNIARIVLTNKGEERIKALKDIAASAPDSVRLSAYFTLGSAALEDGQYDVAAEAYAGAAKSDSEGALGLTAALSQAETLIRAEKSAEALALLQELYTKLKTASQSIPLRLLMAEAAVHAGNRELAAQTYQALAKEIPGHEGEYFRARATALAGEKPQKE